jgi:hypothetical protein
MLPPPIADAKEATGRALAALDDVHSTVDEGLRELIVDVHGRLSRWSETYYGTQLQIAQRMHDGSVPSSAEAARVRAELRTLIASDLDEVAPVADKLRATLLHIDRALDLLRDEEAALQT